MKKTTRQLCIKFATCIYSRSGGRRRFILLLITGRSVHSKYPVRHSHVHVHPNWSRILLERQSMRRSIGLRGSGSAISQSHLGEWRGGAPVCEKNNFRSFETERRFAMCVPPIPALASACVRWRRFRFYSTYRNRRSIDTRTICRGLYEVADKCYGLRWRTILRMHAHLSELTSHEWEFNTASNPRRNDSEANSHRSRVLDRSRLSFSKHYATR